MAANLATISNTTLPGILLLLNARFTARKIASGNVAVTGVTASKDGLAKVKYKLTRTVIDNTSETTTVENKTRVVQRVNLNDLFLEKLSLKNTFPHIDPVAALTANNVNTQAALTAIQTASQVKLGMDDVLITKRSNTVLELTASNNSVGFFGSVCIDISAA